MYLCYFYHMAGESQLTIVRNVEDGQERLTTEGFVRMSAKESESLLQRRNLKIEKYPGAFEMIEALRENQDISESTNKALIRLLI